MRTQTDQATASNAQRLPYSPTAVATLRPTQAPGRLTRKARHYLPQILELRAQGYTLEAIQQALAAVGVPVSISTVRRESMRPVPPAPRSVRPAAVPVSSTSAAAASPVLPNPSNGKDIAAAYAQNLSTNPLTRAKECKP